MTAPTEPLRPPPSVAATDCPIGTLEAALARPARQLRFEPALEATYERDTGRARATRHVLCSLLGAVSFWALSATTVDRLEGTAAPLGTLRLAAMIALLVGTASIWAFCRSGGRGLLRETLSMLSILALAGYSIFAARYLYDAQALMQGSGLLIIFIYTGVAARLRFGFAVVVNLVTWLGYALFARAETAATRAMLDNHLMLFGSVVLFSTVGNYLLEFRERRNYLLECLKAKHHAALLVDAEALRELTLRDSLTRLFNRRHFDAEMARLCAVGGEGTASVGLLHVDIDHFKRYNDRYGHPAGDRCLTEIGAALAAVAERHGGLAARVGGEEFAVLLSRHDLDRAAAVAAELCGAVRALGLPHADSPVAGHVSISVGAAASVPAPGVWASTLVGAADAALYAAKKAGRDRSVRFEPPLVLAVSPRTRTVSDAAPPDPEAPAEALAAIERLSGLLDGRRLGWLRFPGDLEAEFQERDSRERRRYLAILITAGLTMTLGYVVLSRPVMPDIVDMMLRNLGAMTIVSLALSTLNLKVAFGWRVREGIATAVIAAFGMAIVWMHSQSRVPTVYSATLALCLLPMFGSLVVAQPLRFSLVPSLLICLGVATVMAPSNPDSSGIWLTTVGVVCVATLYSLIGGYLLERASRRAYLLDRLRIAQLEVLRHNTAHLRRLATLDPLTRLPNRRHFEAELERLAAVCSATQQPLGLLILDIDHFKHYNDGYGHPAGDACLQRIGAALQQWGRGAEPPPLARGSAVPARIGGEEFGVLLPGSNASGALAAAQRLRELVRDLRIEHAHSPMGRVVTVSVGAASLVLDSAADTRLLLKTADAALYRAKGLGRDRAAA